MGMRIRVLSGCLALGATAVILTGTAAHAAPVAGTHATVTAVSTGGPGGNCHAMDAQASWNGVCRPNPCQTGVYDESNGNNGNNWYSETPTPTPTCTTQEPSSPPPPPPTITATPTQTVTPPVPQVTSPAPAPASSSPPPGAPQTGGGGGIGGSGNVALAVGGAVTAVAAGLLGLFAFRRWRRTRLPAA